MRARKTTCRSSRSAFNDVNSQRGSNLPASFPLKRRAVYPHSRPSLMNYSEDEVLVLVVSSVLALATWALWARDAVLVMRPWRRPGHRTALMAMPALCAVLLFAVLKLWSSEDVRHDPAYLVFYMVLGAAWVGLGQRFLPWLGLGARDDVVERGNRAALPAVGGALAGLTVCFAGANIGNGPGWWVVLFSGGLASGALMLLWTLVALQSRLPDKVTIDRDPAAGLRAAGFFVGTGMVLGRAAAGDWVSAGQTVRDSLHVGWTALLVAAVAVAAEALLPARPEQDGISVLVRGGLVALFQIGLASGLVLAFGTW